MNMPTFAPLTIEDLVWKTITATVLSFFVAFISFVFLENPASNALNVLLGLCMGTNKSRPKAKATGGGTENGSGRRKHHDARTEQLLNEPGRFRRATSECSMDGGMDASLGDFFSVSMGDRSSQSMDPKQMTSWRVEAGNIRERSLSHPNMSTQPSAVIKALTANTNLSKSQGVDLLADEDLDSKYREL
jgi:hypothetical protein